MLWAELNYSSFITQKNPYDFKIKFSEKNDQTWVDVMTADDMYNGISLNLAMLTFEDDYHLR